jgi:4,5-dihydroxyphthalate decarboxylase
MAKLNLVFGCWGYDRVRPLADGTVKPDGIELNFLDMPVEETFFRQARFREFDVSEMSLSSYTVSLFRDPKPFIAIPVWPSRFFRHSCIYVNAKSGIKSPKDLVGKKIGVPEFQMTAPVWIRGILDEHYSVPVDSVTYWTGGEEEPGRPEKQKLDLPKNIKVSEIPHDKTLSQMLASGEIDALHTAREPSSFDGRRVVRLFPRYYEEEKAYYKKTRIFPIMHTIVLRRDLYEANRWIAQTLTKAFIEAQRHVYEMQRQTAAHASMLPFHNAHVDEARELMGEDYWPYGFEPNKETLATFLEYHHQCGLSKKRLKPEELFAPETLESFKI